MPSGSSLVAFPPQKVPHDHTAIVFNWVNSAEASSPSTWTSSHKRSRKVQEAEEEGNLPKKRRKDSRTPLGSLPENTMPRDESNIVPQGSNTGSGNSPGSRRSPRKASPNKTPLGTPSAPSTPWRQPTGPFDQALDSADRESTPRPQGSRSLNLNSATEIPPPTYGRYTVHEDLSSGASTSSRGSGNTHPRSRSPVKKFADLSFADIPTEYENLDGKVARRLNGVLSKYKRLRDISMGIQVIPSTLKSLIENKVDEDDYPPLHAYASSQSPFPDNAINEYSTRLGEKAFEILAAAHVCDKRRLPEADWNTEVHIPLLKLVVSNPSFCNAVDYANVTTARIAPSTLLKKHSNGSSRQSKQVDFCIVLKPSPDLMNRINAQLKPLSIEHQSINQTMMSSARKLPFALSLKTKGPFCGDETSDVQLST